MKNVTAIGQQNTDSTSLLEVSLVGGSPQRSPNFQTIESYPDDNPKTTIGSKKLPLDVCPPSAIHAMARAFANGAEKYGAYNWRAKTVSSSIYYAACLRHLMAWFDGEDLAGDSGLSHLDHALACIGILVDADSIGRLNDNRPLKGATSKIQEEWNEKHK